MGAPIHHIRRENGAVLVERKLVWIAEASRTTAPLAVGAENPAISIQLQNTTRYRIRHVDGVVRSDEQLKGVADIAPQL